MGLLLSVGAVMLLGLISDTHDRLENIEKAVRFFNSVKLDYVLHAGDFIAPFTAPYFGKLTVPLIGVFGNNDGEKSGLERQFAPFGKIFHGPHSFELKGVRIGLAHTKEDSEKLSDGHRIVVYGHTHVRDISHRGHSVLVNPGECCGYVTGTATVATVDVKTLKVSMTEL